MAKKRKRIKKFIPRKAYNKYSKYKSNRNYQDTRYTNWRKAVRERDDYHCKWPGCAKKKVYCHHIMKWADYPQLRYVVANGICLCYLHHKRVTGKEEQYSAFLFSLIRPKHG